MRSTKFVGIASALVLVASSMALFGCSSSPDEAQLRQLAELKDEVATLEKTVAAKQQEKAALEQSNAEKTAKLNKCNSDQQVVRERLGK